MANRQITTKQTVYKQMDSETCRQERGKEGESGKEGEREGESGGQAGIDRATDIYLQLMQCETIT